MHLHTLSLSNPHVYASVLLNNQMYPDVCERVSEAACVFKRTGEHI